MFSAIKTLSSLLGLFFFLSCIVFFVLNLKKYKIYLGILLMFLLRSIYFTQSSRYYSVFIIIFLVFWGSFLNEARSHKFIIYFLTLLFVLFEITRSFSQSTNKYYFCLFDTLDYLDRQNQQSLTFVPQKDINRFQSYPSLHPYDDKANNYSLYFEDYFYYGHPTFFFLHASPGALTSFDDSIASPYLKKKYIMKTQITSHSNKSYYILKTDTYNNSPYNLSETLIKQKSLISGGDMETVLDNKTVQSFLSKWIEDGETFYANDDILFPSAQILVNSWTIYQDKQYPHIFLDNTTPINGKYSLHVKFRSKNQTPLYLFNQIPRQSFVLSFNIKSLDKESLFVLFRYDYISGRIKESDRRNYIFLTDSDIHHYDFFFSSSELLGDSSLFIISGSNTEFLLDDLSCYSIPSNH